MVPREKYDALDNPHSRSVEGDEVRHNLERLGRYGAMPVRVYAAKGMRTLKEFNTRRERAMVLPI